MMGGMALLGLCYMIYEEISDSITIYLDNHRNGNRIDNLALMKSDRDNGWSSVKCMMEARRGRYNLPVNEAFEQSAMQMEVRIFKKFIEREDWRLCVTCYNNLKKFVEENPEWTERGFDVDKYCEGIGFDIHWSEKRKAEMKAKMKKEEAEQIAEAEAQRQKESDAIIAKINERKKDGYFKIKVKPDGNGRFKRVRVYYNADGEVIKEEPEKKL